MKKIRRYLIIGFSVLFWIQLNAQEKDVYMTLQTWKYSDMSRALITTLTMDGEEDEIPAQDIYVSYYTVADTGEILIDRVLSDEKGIAKLIIPEGVYIHKDEEGYMQLLARVEEDETYFGTEEELAIKDVVIDFSFALIDSVKTIVFSGSIIGNNGEEMPLADDDLYFYVPRMFSDLKIAEGWFEEEGTGEIEFPNDIIGDTLGNIQIVARIEDHSDYGWVERSHDINWAIPKHQILAECPSRELWTPVAPLWMIITLIIMLAGVWGHYIYAMYELYRIKKSAKKLKD
jgi:hypothetical protein